MTKKKNIVLNLVTNFFKQKFTSLNWAVKLFRFFKLSFINWQKNDCATYAAALSFYALFSFGPLAILAISTFGIFYGQSNARDLLILNIQLSYGSTVSELIYDLVSTPAAFRQNIYLAVLSTTFLLYFVIRMLDKLQDGVNKIWNNNPEKNIKTRLKRKLTSVLALLGILLVMIFIMLGQL